MKVGILTFHNAYNYGAILQTYATQELIKELGHDSEVIDYHNRAIDNHYEVCRFHLRSMPKRRFYMIPFYLLEKYFFWKRRKAYNRFVSDYIQLSSSAYNQGEIFSFDAYDIILIGSDQVWNKRITGGFDDIYWGDFTIHGETRKIAWSVCMNNVDLTDSDISYIKQHLNNFDALSVREDSLLNLISGLVNKQVCHTLDPTLLLSENKWINLCNAEIKESGFVAVYAVRKETEVAAVARQIARFLGKPLVIIRSYSNWMFSKENKEYCGPIEFLSYIKNADFVVSNSFHGTAFSLIFKKQFACPVLEDNVRIDSLLKSVNLKNRCIHSAGEIHSLKPIDYNEVGKTMDVLKKDSISFLHREMFGGRK